MRFSQLNGSVLGFFYIFALAKQKPIMKKKLSLLFLICILSALNIYAEVYEGSCGTNVRYSLDTSTGLLSITGTGAMNNYNYYSSVPWYSNKEYVKTVEISNGVTSIGNYAFNECSGLTSVTIPNSVTSIEDYAFVGCYKLTSVTIGNSVTGIGNFAFSECSGLTSVIIPNSVTSIGNYAFSDCSGLTSVIIPNSVTSIGNSAFDHCFKLTSITIPNSVTSIGSGAFRDCSGLTSVTIPNSVTNIGNKAFYGADIPTIVSLIENPSAIKGKTDSYRTFSQNTFMNATLYVPKGTKEKYKSTTGWKDFVFIEE